MKLTVNAKKVILLAIMTAFFFICYSLINKTSDPLARYPYVTEDNRKLIMSLSNDDINYIVDNNIKPETFISYIGLANFDIRNVDTYNDVKKLVDNSNEEICSYVNAVINRDKTNELTKYLNKYPLNLLTKWYLLDYDDGILALDPEDYEIILNDKTTIFEYETPSLALVNPYITNGKEIWLKTEADEALATLITEYNKEVKKDSMYFNDITMVQGYLSYFEQDELKDEFHLRNKGHNYEQTGNILKFVSDEGPLSTNKDYLWLNDNATKYGFEISEEKTSSGIALVVLRYLGK